MKEKKGIQTVLDNPQEYGLQKPTDKAEPKFHVGDIIIHKENGAISKVNKILSYDYELISFETENTLFLDQNIINENSKLWTIQDAKDGDVLRVKNLTFIFQEITNDNVCHEDAAVARCSYEDNDDGFGVSGPDCITDLKLITPAAKEQRDLLFQKMKEAGYEWDTEKKELKKIEQNSAWSEEDEEIVEAINDYIKNLDILFYEIKIGNKDILSKEFREKVQLWLKSLKYRPQPKQEWSKDDETFLNTIISDLDYSKSIHNKAKCNFIDKEIKWFKSLKERYTWKPSDEQMDVLWDSIKHNLHLHPVLKSLYNDLKKLREE